MIKYDHLLGLEFKHGTRDCYELARDFYRDNFQIELEPIARPDKWWDHGLNLYMDLFRSQGFEVIHCLPRDIRVGDGFLMAVYVDGARQTPLENKSRVANHCAIHVGQGRILHHVYGRLSDVENYKGVWFNTTVAILRHKDVPAVIDKPTVVNFMTLLPPAKRAKLEAAIGAVSGGN